MNKLVHLIDDEGDLRENITELLEIEGYEVKAQGLTELLQVIDQEPRLVLFNGFSHPGEANQFIRWTKNKPTQVIIISDDKDQYSTQADATVSLPFTQRELISAVNHLSR